MFVISGHVTDVTFILEKEMGISGDVIFSLDRQQIQMHTSGNSSPIEMSSEIIVAVERFKDGSLYAIACYDKNRNAFIDKELILKYFSIACIVTGLLYLPPISFVEFSNLTAQTIIGLLQTALGMFLFFRYNKFLKAEAAILHRLDRLHRISQLRKNTKE